MVVDDLDEVVEDLVQVRVSSSALSSFARFASRRRRAALRRLASRRLLLHTCVRSHSQSCSLCVYSTVSSTLYTAPACERPSKSIQISV